MCDTVFHMEVMSGVKVHERNNLGFTLEGSQ